MFSKALPSVQGIAASAARSTSRRSTRTIVAPVSRWYSAEASSETAKSESTNGKDAGEAEKKISGLEQKVKDLEKDILYHRAELQTLNRRIIEERNKASEFAITKFARSLLSTTDVLTTALKHVPKPIAPNTPLSSLVEGVTMTQKALHKTFAEAGVIPMVVERGAVFDPNLHEATFQIPKEVAGPKEVGGGSGEWGNGEVVEVGKEGWMIGSRVLRPAQVGVTQIE